MTHNLSSQETGRIWAHQRDARVPQSRGEIFQLVKCRTEYYGKVARPPNVPDPAYVAENPERDARRARLRRNLELVKRGIAKRKETEQRARGIKPPKPDKAVLQDWQRSHRVYVGEKSGTVSQISNDDRREYLIRVGLGLQPLTALTKHREEVHTLFQMTVRDFVKAVQDGKITL